MAASACDLHLAVRQDVAVVHGPFADRDALQDQRGHVGVLNVPPIGEAPRDADHDRHRDHLDRRLLSAEAPGREGRRRDDGASGDGVWPPNRAELGESIIVFGDAEHRALVRGRRSARQ
jgi:hypothetical protein